MKYRGIRRLVEAEPSLAWFAIRMYRLDCLPSIRKSVNKELSKEGRRSLRMLLGIGIGIKIKPLQGKGKTAKMQGIERDQLTKTSFKGLQQKLNQLTLLALKASSLSLTQSQSLFALQWKQKTKQECLWKVKIELIDILIFLLHQGLIFAF